jgi:FkbM family methyltransferase
MKLQKYSYYLASIFSLITGIREWPLVLRIFLSLPTPDKKTITLRKTSLRFQVRGKMDIWSIKETFLDRFYEKFGVPIQDGWKIVDIGAGIGEYTLFAACGYPGNSVHAYEPFPESASLLTINRELNQAAGIKIFPAAVGGQPGTAILDLTSGEPLQFSTEAKQSSADALRVPVIPLAEVLDRIGHSCDVLKMDCEGAEYAILFQTSDEIFASINHIIMEYHDGVTAYSHRDLVDFLGVKGFCVEVFPNFVHPELGYLHASRHPESKR